MPSKNPRQRVTPATRRRIEERDLFACLYCGKAGRLEMDHVIPRKKNGKTRADNLCAACPSCNHIKSDWPVALFAMRLESEKKGTARAILARLKKHLARPLKK